MHSTTLPKRKYTQSPLLSSSRGDHQRRNSIAPSITSSLVKPPGTEATHTQQLGTTARFRSTGFSRLQTSSDTTSDKPRAPSRKSQHSQKEKGSQKLDSAAAVVGDSEEDGLEFRPENIKHLTQSNPEEETMDLPIQSPEAASDEFDIIVPPLFEVITHVSLVNYTIITPPSTAERPNTALFVVVTLPELVGAPDTHPALSPFGGASGLGSMPGVTPRFPPRHPSTGPPTGSPAQITLPVVGTSTQVEYIPEKALLAEFRRFSGSRIVHVSISDGAGNPVTVSRFYMLLRIYGRDPSRALSEGSVPLRDEMMEELAAEEGAAGPPEEEPPPIPTAHSATPWDQRMDPAFLRRATLA
ncbi:hypothetical protein PAPYR_3439 [Paratrimastix pyriformis]|uniref:Uncharacterized protein n=1 Tax=Paratrimastix pyriformis TaxID=342808 RepID=A0ABQ8UMK7_9EUKA|nr:hypothetical protein PAPYR_3439 [Paratrimastix pyriformis]